MKRISVFGGSKPKPGDEAYINALYLGKLLGQAGFTVLTGGYIGTMEAVSRGAAENGGYVIGVTCDEIESYRPVKPNRWLHEEIKRATLRERIFSLIEECDAALGLPGGIGTLTEVVTMWNLLLTSAISFRPLILVGTEWKATILDLYRNLGDYIPTSQRRLILFTPDADSAIALLHHDNEVTLKN